MQRHVFGIVTLALATFLSAACQQPQHGSTQPKTAAAPAASDVSLDSATPNDDALGGKFHAETKALVRDLSTRLVSACSGQATDVEACFREHILMAFDDSGEARKYCDASGSVEDYAGCVVTGNYTIDVLKKLGASKMPTEGDWQAPSRRMSALMASALLDATDGCLEGDADAIESCQEAKIRDSLDVPNELVARCGTGRFDFRKGECIGEAVSIEYMRKHIARI